MEWLLTVVHDVDVIFRLSVSLWNPVPRVTFCVIEGAIAFAKQPFPKRASFVKVPEEQCRASLVSDAAAVAVEERQEG